MQPASPDRPAAAPWSTAFITRLHRYKSLLQRRWWIPLLTICLGLFVQAWVIKGSMCLHQQGHRAARIHPHPGFEGIDVEGLGDQCYLQMISNPRSSITEVFYEPIRRK